MQRPALSRIVALALPTLLIPCAVAAADTTGEASGHVELFTVVLLGLACVTVIAMLGRWLAGLCDQPGVLGELIVGVVVGNIGYALGVSAFALIMHMGDSEPVLTRVFTRNLTVEQAAAEVFTPQELARGGRGAQVVALLTGPDAPNNVVLGIGLWMASNLGVILLLFLVGLESSLADMLQVGMRALMVAIVGVVVPFALGYLAGLWLAPTAPTATHLFLGATLCATSVGITARVFKDLGRLQSSEARIILGAAVIDDILGLIVLAVMAGIAATGSVNLGEIAWITLLSVAFLGILMLLGERLVRRLLPAMKTLDRHHVKLLFPLALAFLLAWLASQIHLAAIVGAFAAGLILSERLFEDDGGKATMEEMVAPLEKVFAPVFFVLMGMQVNLASFFDLSTLGLALVLTIAALVGKGVCGLPAGPGCDKLSVGLGMIPRGEVGLIFASVGKSLGVVSDPLFAALVVVIIVTTLVTPPGLKWSLRRRPADDKPPATQADSAPST
jgi:Kef-type K+ transport system membrane component KefB